MVIGYGQEIDRGPVEFELLPGELVVGVLERYSWMASSHRLVVVGVVVGVSVYIYTLYTKRPTAKAIR